MGCFKIEKCHSCLLSLILFIDRQVISCKILFLFFLSSLSTWSEIIYLLTTKQYLIFRQLPDPERNAKEMNPSLPAGGRNLKKKRNLIYKSHVDKERLMEEKKMEPQLFKNKQTTYQTTISRRLECQKQK